MQSCSQTNIGGGRQLRLGGGGGLTTTMQQLRGLEAYPKNIFRSKIASEIIFGPNLATTLTRTSIVYTVLDSLGIHKLEGISLAPGMPDPRVCPCENTFPGLLFLLFLLTLPMLSQSESRLKTQTLAPPEFTCRPM